MLTRYLCRAVKRQLWLHPDRAKMLAVIVCGLLALILIRKALRKEFTEVEYIADHLQITYQVLNHSVDPKRHFALSITLYNSGHDAIKHGNWTIYFCHVHKMDTPPEFLNTDVDPETYGFKFNHISGYLHRLQSTPKLKPILPYEAREIRAMAYAWSIARSDIMPNWYVIGTGSSSTAKVIASTAGESLNFTGQFNTSKQWKRFENIDTDETDNDAYNPFTTLERYDHNVVPAVKIASPVIPTVRSFTQRPTSKLTIHRRDWVIVIEHQSATISEAAGYLAVSCGLTISHELPASLYILFTLTNHVLAPSSDDEAYRLQVHNDTQTSYIHISAKTDRGAFYAVQTLLQLDESRRTTNNNEYDLIIPQVEIHDSPRFPYRGLHLDVARNFQDKDTVMKLLDVMARYKLNRLHLHLTDDEGWRLEIPGLPELTEVGGRRCHDLSEESCLLPQLGSGPTATGSGSGFYTVQDYRDILQYAVTRHIEVIPEIDSPGHGRAAIKAMEARYKRLLVEQSADADEYLISDLDDKSLYATPQYFNDNAMNPCIESTYNFIDKIVRSLVEFHKNISPLKVYHFGGDEVGIGAWTNSPSCKQFLLKHPEIKKTSSLKKYFVKRVSEIVSRNKLSLGGWEDGLMSDRGIGPFNVSDLPVNEIYTYPWKNVAEWGGLANAVLFANAGYKVVIVHGTFLYFDHPYEPDPEERGYYWAARYIDTQKVFSFRPDHLYDNENYSRFGLKLSRETICGVQDSKCPPLKKPHNILGIQGNIWSETVRTRDQLFSMAFPRVLALAERAWHKALWEDTADSQERKQLAEEDWIRFANILGQKDLLKLDEMGITYRIPPPGIDSSQTASPPKLSALYPGLTVEFSNDNGLSWQTELDASRHTGHMMFRSRSADGRRTSRVITDIIPAYASAHFCQSNVTCLLCLIAISLSVLYSLTSR